MKKFIIFLLVCIGLIWLFVYTFKTGKFQTFVDEHPNPSWGVRLQYMMGAYYFYQKQFEPALHNLERVITVYPTSTLLMKARFMRAECYERLFKREEAKIAYEEYLRLYPHSKKKTVARFRYDRLCGM